MIEEADVERLAADEELPVPGAWQQLPSGKAMPNVVRAIRLARVGADKVVIDD